MSKILSSSLAVNMASVGYFAPPVNGIKKNPVRRQEFVAEPRPNEVLQKVTAAGQTKFINGVERRFRLVPGAGSASGAARDEVAHHADEDPVKPVGKVGELPPDPIRPRVLNAILRHIARELNFDGLFFLSQTGKIMPLEISLPEDRDALSYYMKIAHDLPESKMIVRLTDDLMDDYLLMVPNRMSSAIELATRIMKSMSLGVVVTHGKGSFFGYRFANLPDGVEPLYTVLQLVLNKFSKDKDDDKAIECPPDTNETTESMKPEKPNLRLVPHSLADILASFDGLFLKNDELNKALKAVGLKQLVLNREENILDMVKAKKLTFPNGMILLGDPGIGKTELKNALVKAYERCGAPTLELSLGSLEERYVGSLANNLTQKFDEAIEQAHKTGKPALVIIDEATNVSTGVDANDSVRRYYQGALDVIKRYSTEFPEIVMVMITNAKVAELDPALSRSLRLEPIVITRPDAVQRGKMIAHNLANNQVIDELSSTETLELAKVFPEATGADICKFALEFFPNMIARLYAERGLETELDIIRYLDEGGEEITLESVKNRVTYDQVLTAYKQFTLGLKQNRAGLRREIGWGR